MSVDARAYEVYLNLCRDLGAILLERGRLREALRAIMLHGTSRAPALGAGDDGDGHWRRIAEDCMGIATHAIALRSEHGRQQAEPRRIAEPQRDDWTRGYATALSRLWHGWHEGHLVELLLNEAGLTVEKLKAAGVEEYDLTAVREALARRCV